MTFDHLVESQTLVLYLKGDIISNDMASDLEQLVEKEIESGISAGAIDISGVNYMNSSGINLLIRLLTKFRNHNGEVLIVNPSEQIKKLLIMTKLNSIFNIVDTKEEALAQLNNVK